MLPTQWAAPHDPGEVMEGWLASFNDKELNALVMEALAYNADLRVAASNVERAAAYVKSAAAGLYPLVTASAFKKTTDTVELKGAVLSASWELDIWGRLRYAERAASAQHAAAQADYTYARRSLAALVAKSWFLSSEIAQQRDLAEESVRLHEKFLTLARDLYRIGKGNQTDVVLAEAGLGASRDALRNLQLAHGQSLQAIEALLGRYPSASIPTPARPPSLPGPAPTGVPSSLLERRPDVIAAERQVAAAFDRVGEAKAARLPSISLTAGLSHLTSSIAILNQRDNPVWNRGGNLFAFLFDGGALQANVKIRTAEQEQALAEYARVGQRAFGEVEDALTTAIALREREIILQQTAADNERALEMVSVQYRIGVKDMHPVLQQQLALYAARSALLRVKSEQLIQRVNLHLALGGDFSAEASRNETDSAIHDAQVPSP